MTDPEKIIQKNAHHNFLNTVLLIAKELFIASLIFYLILFILEAVFPGLVSNNFSLNYVLFIVIGLGVLAAFAPEVPKEKEEKGKPKVTDYLLSIFLGLVGGALTYFKLQINSPARIILAVICSSLIITLSLVLLLVEDEEVTGEEERIEQFIEKDLISRRAFILPIAFFRLLLFKKVKLPIIIILLIVGFMAFSLPTKTGYPPRKIDLGKLLVSLVPQNSSTPTPTATPTPSSTPTPEPKPITVPSPNLFIKVHNGGLNKDTASDFAKTLENTGFTKVFFGEADNYNYKNATIKFRSEDEEQAKIIKELLEKEYSTITCVPSATTSAEITIILGAKETTSSAILR